MPQTKGDIVKLIKTMIPDLQGRLEVEERDTEVHLWHKTCWFVLEVFLVLQPKKNPTKLYTYILAVLVFINRK